jgi:hypothetical protein
MKTNLNNVATGLKTENLQMLFNLRQQEKSIKSQIESIKSLAIEEAKAIQPDGGKFEVTDVGTFVLDREPIFNFDDYRRYREQEATEWRAAKRKKLALLTQSKSYTAAMHTALKTFALLYPDKEPDDYDYTLKVLS